MERVKCFFVLSSTVNIIQIQVYALCWKDEGMSSCIQFISSPLHVRGNVVAKITERGRPEEELLT
jgi:hypothetical protein